MPRAHFGWRGRSARAARRSRASWLLNVQQPPVTNNLYAWYDASAVNGLFAANVTTDATALSSWADLSGNGRDLSQATAANQPLFRNASLNLLTYNQGATCEDGTYINDFTVVVGSGTVSASTAQSAYGAYSLLGATSATGNFGFGIKGASRTTGIVGGNTYTARVSILSSVSRSCQVILDWYDSAGTAIDSAIGTGTSSSTSVWTDLSVTGVAPETAVGARVYVNVLSAGNAESHYADKFGLFADTVTTWVPPVTLLNNQPTVQFDGNLQILTRGSSSLSQPFTIYAVHKAESIGTTSSTSDRAIVNMANANLSVVRGGGSTPGRAYAYAGSTFPSVTGTTMTTAGVVSYVYDNTSQSFRVNGVAGIAANAGSGSLSGTLGVGGRGSANSAVLGGISAVLIYSASHDTTTRQSIERWLGARYGITVA